MAQNANNQDDTSSSNDGGARTTEEDLRKLFEDDEKVDDSSKGDQDENSDDNDDNDDSDEGGDDDGKTDDDSKDDDSDDDSQDDSDDDDSEFVKEFPNIKGDTLVDYARNLEHTISESNKEGKRLADENADLKQKVADLTAGKKTDDSNDDDDSQKSDLSPESAYIRQKMNDEIDEAFKEFRKSYPQVEDAAEYSKFVAEVKVLGQAIKLSQDRFASPKELYTKAAAILGWEANDKVDNKDRLKIALKDRSSISKTTSSTKKAPKSKVTEAMIKLNRSMYPGKSDEEIRKELEPYVQ